MFEGSALTVENKKKGIFKGVQTVPYLFIFMLWPESQGSQLLHFEELGPFKTLEDVRTS